MNKLVICPVERREIFQQPREYLAFSLRNTVIHYRIILQRIFAIYSMYRWTELHKHL